MGKEGADMDEKQLRELQLKSLETLKEFIKFCEDNFLTYYLIGGCLIGAVRSGGFLPWDDDIDVFITNDFGKCGIHPVGLSSSAQPKTFTQEVSL